MENMEEPKGGKQWTGNGKGNSFLKLKQSMEAYNFKLDFFKKPIFL